MVEKWIEWKVYKIYRKGDVRLKKIRTFGARIKSGFQEVEFFHLFFFAKKQLKKGMIYNFIMKVTK